MITDLILNIIGTLWAAIVALIPDIPAPDLAGMAHSLSPLWSKFAWADEFVALDQVEIILGLVIVFYAALHAIRFIIYVATKFHVLGGSDS